MSGQRPGSGDATTGSHRTRTTQDRTTQETDAQPATTPSPEPSAPPFSAQTGNPSALTPGPAPAGSSPAGLNGSSPVVGAAGAAGIAVASASGVTVMANGHQGPGGGLPGSWSAPAAPPPVGGHGETLTASWVFPGEPASAALARRVTREIMLAWGAGDDTDVDDVVLVVDELVTNAVVHGCGPVTLLLRLECGVLAGEVSDCAQALPDLGSNGDEGDWGRESGRGLWLVSVLAADHGVRPEADGKTLWFTRVLNHRNE